MANNWYQIAATVGYNTNWSDYDTSLYGPAQYVKDASGIVRFKGIAKKSVTSTNGDIIFTLPKGYRPAPRTRPQFECIGAAAGLQVVRIDVSGWEEQGTLGQVIIYTPPSDWVSLSNIQFLAEQ